MRDYFTFGSGPENFSVYNGQLYFSAYDGIHGRELWRYDGTNASLAADIQPGGGYSSSNPNGLIVYKGKLFFSADDGLHGFELWSFDGTNAQMVAEINPTEFRSVRRGIDPIARFKSSLMVGAIAD